jgi:hypothetical protein
MLLADDFSEVFGPVFAIKGIRHKILLNNSEYPLAPLFKTTIAYKKLPEKGSQKF